jgi:Flp pilus assembly protein TadG
VGGDHDTRSARSPSRKGDRGAALIEAALVLPVLVLMIVGIIEIGYLFRSATIVNTSSRNGARLVSAQYGAATTTASEDTVMDNVALTVEKDLTSRASVDTPVALWIYKAKADGSPQSGNFTTCGSSCYTYTWNAGTGHFTRTSPSGSWTDAVACGLTHDSVGVFVRATHTPVGFTNAFGTFTLAEHTVMRLEPSGSCPGGT